MKRLFILLAFVSVGALSLTLSSCGSSSSSTATTTRPGNWTQIANFSGNGRSGAASFVIDGKAYVGGGFDGVKRLQDWWQFDPTKNGWTKKTDFPGTARSGAVAFTIGGKGYVGTGSTATTGVYLKDFWEFDPIANAGAGSWKQVKDFGDPLETGRFGCISFTINNRGYVAAGSTTGSNALNDLWEYLPATNEWKQRTGLSFKRFNGFAMSIGNFAYIVGGSNNGLLIRNVEQYDPASDAWTQKLALNQKDANGVTIVQPFSRESAATFTIDGLGYFAGGNTGGLNGSSLGDTWQYNPTTDTWIQYYSFNTSQQYGGAARDGAVGFAIGAIGYISTGRNSSLRLDDTLKFEPTGTPPAN